MTNAVAEVSAVTQVIQSQGWDAWIQNTASGLVGKMEGWQIAAVLGVLIICLTIANPKWARDGIMNFGNLIIGLALAAVGKKPVAKTDTCEPGKCDCDKK